MPTYNGTPAVGGAFTAHVLTDEIFLLYGGLTGTSSFAQRNVAYVMAEEQMEEYIDSFIIPTTITGTYFWGGGNPVELGHGNLIAVNAVSVNSRDWQNSCTVNTVTGCHAVRGDGKYGLVDVAYLVSCGGCTSVVGYPPYNVVVSFESGLQSGSTYQPSMLQALTLAAQVNLNEIDVSLSNETIADAGIEFFINQSYHEKRVKGYNTAFGNSAVAQRIARLVRKYRTKPAIGFHK